MCAVCVSTKQTETSSDVVWTCPCRHAPLSCSLAARSTPMDQPEKRSVTQINWISSVVRRGVVGWFTDGEISWVFEWLGDWLRKKFLIMVKFEKNAKNRPRRQFSENTRTMAPHVKMICFQISSQPIGLITRGRLLFSRSCHISYWHWTLASWHYCHF